jgi:predicted nucleic acid-binding protein
MMSQLRYSLDTTFLVRLLTGDPVPYFHLAAGFLEKCRREECVVEVLDLVLAEAYFALQYHYGFPKDAALNSLHQFAEQPVVAVSNYALEILSLPSLSSANPGFVDLLIHGFSRTKNCKLVTFEKKARKLEGVIVLE